MKHTEYVMGRKAKCKKFPLSSTCNKGRALFPLKHSAGNNLSCASVLTLVGKSSNMSAMIGEADRAAMVVSCFTDDDVAVEEGGGRLLVVVVAFDDDVVLAPDLGCSILCTVC